MGYKDPRRRRAYYVEYRTINYDRIARQKAARRLLDRKGDAIYRERHRQRIAERQKKYTGKRSLYRHARRARLAGNGGHLSRWIAGILWAQQHGLCAACEVSLYKTGHHLDHVIPLARGGKNEDDNVQLLCPKCNLKKGSKILT